MENKNSFNSLHRIFIYIFKFNKFILGINMKINNIIYSYFNFQFMSIFSSVFLHAD